MAEDTTAHWSLDKRVPLALILTIAIQTGAAVWWAGGITTRVDALSSLGLRIEKLEDERYSLAQRLTAVETRLDEQTTLLTEILAAVRGR